MKFFTRRDARTRRDAHMRRDAHEQKRFHLVQVILNKNRKPPTKVRGFILASRMFTARVCSRFFVFKLFATERSKIALSASRSVGGNLALSSSVVSLGVLSIVLLSILGVGFSDSGKASAAINEQLNFQGRLLTSSGSLVPDGNYHVRFKLYEDGDGDLGGGDENLAWTETRSTGNLVRVVNGYMSVQLGSVTAFGSSVDWGNSTLWLSIEIGGNGGSAAWDGELDPFMRLTSTPYAFSANNLDGLDSTEFVQLGQGEQAVTTNSTLISIDKTGTGDLIDLQVSNASRFNVSNAGNLTIAGTADVQGASITIGQSSTTDGTLIFENNTNAFTTTLAVTDATADRTITFPNATGTVALNTTGSATTGVSAFVQGGNTWATTAILGTTDAQSLQFVVGGVDALTIADGGAVTFQNETDTTSGFQVLDADGGTPVFNVDTTNERVAVGDATPDAKLDIEGGADEVQLLVQGHSTQTNNILEVQNDGGTVLLSVSNTTGLTVRGTNTEAVEGSEMITLAADRDFSSSTGNWTGTNWSIGSGVATHIAGDNDYTLSNTGVDPDPIVGRSYAITFTHDASTAGGVNALRLCFGGACGPYVGQDIYARTETHVVTATSTAALYLDTDATWAGTIDNVSIKEITISTPVITINNDDGTVGLEVRAGGSGDNNTFVGVDSGLSNTTGYSNAALGYSALQSNTTGYNNSALGFQSLQLNSTGYNNTAQGTNALYSNTVGDNNTSIGANSLYYNTVGYWNTAIGSGALYSNTTGAANTAQGYNSLYSSTTGFQNTAQGYNSLYSTTTGAGNTAQGSNSLYSNNTGTQNTAQGYETLYSNTDGNYNTAQGTEALRQNTGGDQNTAIGYGALRQNQTGGNNTSLGFFSGYNTTGANNIFLGFQAGQSNTTGSNNIVIGYDIDLQSLGTANALNIGNIIFGTGINSTDTTIDPDANIGIGVADPSSKLQVAGTLTLGNSSNVDGLVVFENSANANQTTISVSANTTGAVGYQFNGNPAGGSGTYTICTTDGNCDGSGGLQGAYDYGNTILAVNSVGDIDLTVSEATNFSVDITGTGSFLVQDNGANVLEIANGGAINLGAGTGTASTLGVTTRTTNATGDSLTISAGTAGAGGSAFVGGDLILQGGDAAGTGNANGGNITLTGGAGTGTGTQGLIIIENLTLATSSTQTCGTSCTITQANVDASGAVIIDATAIALDVTLPDPTNTTAGRVVYVTAALASNDFTLVVNGGGQGNEIAMRANTTATMIWNGTDWTAAGASSSTTLQAAYDNTLTSAGGAEIVLSAPGGNADGFTIRNNDTTPIEGGILEVQSAIGTNLFSVNNLGTELAANGGVETLGTFATNWTAVGSSTVTRTTTSGQYVTGQAGAQVATTALANDGARNNLSGNPAISTTYQVSFAAKLSSGTFTTLDVQYSRDGGTSLVACTEYSTQTLTTSEWSKVTCTITTDGTTATNPDLIIRQTDATARTFWIDNLSFMRNDGTTEPSHIQIGGGLSGGPITLFTLDRSSAPPVTDGNQTFLGSMYYDTTSGRIQCYEADGWGACGSPPNNIITLTPEYAGSVLNGSGVGTMTADFCSNETGILAINATLCDSGEAVNYYAWTSPQATSQTYSVYLTFQLPDTFKEFMSNDTITLDARTTDTTDASVTYEIFRSTGAAITECGSDTTVTSSNNTWQTVAHNGSEKTSCSFAGGDRVIFKLNMTARNNDSVYVSDINFTYTNQ